MLQRRIRRAKRWPASCTGLAAYAALNVDGIRTLLVLRTLATAGVLGLVYIALAFILPIDAKREA